MQQGSCVGMDCINQSRVCVQSVGRLENIVGWYHSHPGYGCWLSGIDVGTQMTQQQFNDPFLAIVVDPHRTIAAGKVEIGAFRTYPEAHTVPKPTMLLPVACPTCSAGCNRGVPAGIQAAR